MATYREIHGKAIKSISTDPSAPTDAGQMWYNTTSDTFKSIVSSAAWRSGPAFSTNRYGASGSGSLTAGLITGGNAVTPSADVPSNATEEWNGTGWGTGGNLNTARYYGGGFGTQTATLFTGGDSRPPGAGSQTTTETYNGSAWTAGTASPTSLSLISGLGTTSAGLIVGSPAFATTTFEYGGSWTAGGAMNTGRRWIGTAGSQTAGVAFGGQIPPSGYSTNVTEEYDGSSWTNGENLNVTRAVNAVGGGINQDASQTNTLAAGGYQSSGSPKSFFNESESYDGTSWTAQPTMGTSIGYGTGGGTGSAGISAGSYTGSIPAVGTTEEFSKSTNVVTAAAWSSGTAFPTNSSGIAGVGPRDAAMAIGGYPPGSPPTGKSFEYNGVAWSAEASLNPNTGTGGVSSAAGTQTAAICTQLPAGGAPYIAAGTYDGSSWSNAEDRPTSNYSDGSAGTLTAGLFFGGGSSPSAYTAATISYDGTDWTVEESMGTARTIVGGCGSSTAALAMGGVVTPPATLTNLTEEYGGESWTAGGVLLTTLRDHRASGPQTDAIVAGGRIQGAPPSTFLTACSRYDGTAWATSPNLAIARGLQGSGNGPVGAAWGAAGYYPGPPSGPTGNRTTSTEHFNVETTALNVKTITTS